MLIRLGRGPGIGPYSSARRASIAEARPIWYDDELRSTLAAISSTCVVAALRNGTAGIPVDRSGLLPLVHDRWSFVFNGFVPDFRTLHMRALRASLPDELKPVFDELVEDYKFATTKRYRQGYVAYIVLADLVRVGWRHTAKPLPDDEP